MPETPTSVKGGPHQLKIRRTDPHGITAVYANDLAATSTGKELFLVFSQVQPPIAENLDALEAVDTVDAVAVAKVVVTPGMVEAILRVLSNYVKTAEEKTDGES